MPSRDVIVTSTILFWDQLLLALGNWLFWIVISRIATISEVGGATTVYSLLLLTTTIAQMGLEYPLLKRTLGAKESIFSSALVIELAIITASIPLVIYSLNLLEVENLQELTWVATGILVFSSVNFVIRFYLLGAYGAKQVLIIDIVGIFVKFAVGYVMVASGYGMNGILVAFLFQFLVMTLVSFPILRLKLGGTTYRISHIMDILKDAVLNTPAKFSRTLIFSLSVVLMASIGMSETDIGIFYIIMMISIVAGGLVSGISYMILPSSPSSVDLSSDSLRIGLSLTVPLIVGLVTAPEMVLSLIGEYYTSGSMALVILALGIVPSSVVMVGISRCNTIGDNKGLVFIGLVQIILFLIFFMIFVPVYGIFGAALSMTLSFVGTSIQSMRVLGATSIRYAVISALAIGAGWSINFISNHVIGFESVISTVISIIFSILIIFMLKNISPGEMYSILTLPFKRDEIID
jgi:O-antigen/teichoic acid export membrane protein